MILRHKFESSLYFCPDSFVIGYPDFWVKNVFLEPQSPPSIIAIIRAFESLARRVLWLTRILSILPHSFGLRAVFQGPLISVLVLRGPVSDLVPESAHAPFPCIRLWIHVTSSTTLESPLSWRHNRYLPISDTLNCTIALLRPFVSFRIHMA